MWSYGVKQSELFPVGLGNNERTCRERRKGNIEKGRLVRLGVEKVGKFCRLTEGEEL